MRWLPILFLPLLITPTFASQPAGYPDFLSVTLSGAGASSGFYALPWDDQFHDFGAGLYGTAGCVTFTQISGTEWRFSVTDNTNDLYLAAPTVTWDGTGEFPAAGLTNFTTTFLTTGGPANAAAFGYANLAASVPEPSCLAVIALFSAGLKIRTRA